MQIKHSTNAGPRERILARAVELFFKQGYHGTGINQIIKEAKVAKASFYDHFGSKENLAVAYLELLSDRRIDLLDRVASDYDDPFEKVMSIFEYLKEWAEDKHHIGCPFLNIASEFPLEDNRIRETVRTHKERQRHLIWQIVVQIYPDVDDRAHTVADTIHLLIEGATVENRVLHSVYPFELAQVSARKLLTQSKH